MRFLLKFFLLSFAFTTLLQMQRFLFPLTLCKIVSARKLLFTIPLGATVNMDELLSCTKCCFCCTGLWNFFLSPSDEPTVVATATLASIGTAGVPSVGFVTLAMVLQSVGLPTEGIALIMGIDRILDMLRTAVNITGDAVCTHQESNFDRAVFNEN